MLIDENPPEDTSLLWGEGLVYSEIENENIVQTIDLGDDSPVELSSLTTTTDYNMYKYNDNIYTILRTETGISLIKNGSSVVEKQFDGNASIQGNFYLCNEILSGVIRVTLEDSTFYETVAAFNLSDDSIQEIPQINPPFILAGTSTSRAIIINGKIFCFNSIGNTIAGSTYGTCVYDNNGIQHIFEHTSGRNILMVLTNNNVIIYIQTDDSVIRVTFDLENYTSLEEISDIPYGYPIEVISGSSGVEIKNNVTKIIEGTTTGIGFSNIIISEITVDREIVSRTWLSFNTNASRSNKAMYATLKDGMVYAPVLFEKTKYNFSIPNGLIITQGRNYSGQSYVDIGIDEVHNLYTTYAQLYINGIRTPFRKYNPDTGVWERLDNFFGEE